MISLVSVRQALLAHENVIGSCRQVSRLGRGENNESFLVLTDKGRFVVRVGLKSKLDKNMRREFLFLRRLSSPVIPQVFVFDDSKSVLSFVFEVLEYRKGHLVKRWSKDHLRSFARVVADLHGVKGSSGHGLHGRGKRFSLAESLRSWMRDYPKEFEDEELRMVYDNLLSELRRHDHLFTSRRSFTVVHGDACADNVLFDKGEASLIDWEWAGFGDPAQDLAKLFFLGGAISPWYLGLSLEQVRFLVGEYCKRRKDATLYERVLLWHEASCFGDMVFFRWRIDNYDKTAHHPLSYYRSVYKKMWAYFRKNYG